jgi:hypothetical protein
VPDQVPMHVEVRRQRASSRGDAVLPYLDSFRDLVGRSLS